jgi:hypothetical protein
LQLQAGSSCQRPEGGTLLQRCAAEVKASWLCSVMCAKLKRHDAAAAGLQIVADGLHAA